MTTYPGRKDSMESYVSDRAPHLAPFAYFTPRTVRVRIVR